jgi:anti-anti-sigma factor
MTHEELYKENEDYSLFEKVVSIRYGTMEKNRHAHGFEEGVAAFLRYCKQKGAERILIDMEGVTFIESLILGTIIKFKKEIDSVGFKSVSLYNPSPEVADTFRMQNLEKMFGTIYESMEEALRELQGAGK